MDALPMPPAQPTPAVHPVLFSSTVAGLHWQARVLTEADIAVLQAFYDANPDYSVLVSGRPPAADEAKTDFHAQPPPDWRFERKWMIGLFDDEGVMIGAVDLIAGLFDPVVWHIGFFVVATALQGRGVAANAHAALEQWVRGQGAQWLRLAVVDSNLRGARFWRRSGYRDVSRRLNVPIGALRHDLRILAKPLAGGTWDGYFRRVAMDRPAHP